MPLDGTQIKQDIDNNLGGKGYRGIRIFNIISALKNLVDWVTTSINSNLGVWFKVGTTNPVGANTDAAYRTGPTVFGRSTDDGTGANVQFQGYFSVNGVQLDMTLLPGAAVTTVTLNCEQIDFNTITTAGTYWVAGGSWKATGSGPGVNIAGINTYGLLIVSKTRDGYLSHVYYSTNYDVCFRMTFPGVAGSWLTWQCTSRRVVNDFQVDGFLRAGSGNSAFKITGVKSSSNLALKTTRYLELTLSDGTIVKVAEVS